MKTETRPEIFTEANKIWTRLTQDVGGGEASMPITIHKKLLDVFHVGEYYYFVLNVKPALSNY